MDDGGLGCLRVTLRFFRAMDLKIQESALMEERKEEALFRDHGE